jgi:hypothetical protein
MRRTVTTLAGLAILGAGCAGGSGASPSSDATSVAPDPSGTTSTDSNAQPSILAVQSAQSATFTGSGETYTLTMEGVDETTVWFTDRPARRAGTEPTINMLAQMLDPDDTDGPPNAAVVWATDQGQAAVAVELVSGSYDEESATLTYEARMLERHEDGLAHFGTSAEIPTGPVGPVSTFVDSIFVYSVCELDVTNKAGRQFGWTQTIVAGYLTSGQTADAIGIPADEKESWSWKQSAGYNSCEAKVDFYEVGDPDDTVISLDIKDPAVGSNSFKVSCANYTCATKTLHNSTTYHVAVVLCADGVTDSACLAKGGY